MTMAERWRRNQLDGIRVRAEDPSEVQRNPDGTAAPLQCPACRSREVTTASKTLNADTYWRCCRCGDVWNVARHRAGLQRARYQPFRP
jgi:DNA-directed RNA polymerase subunit M/transcription elongation factor TFIIS